MNVLTTSLSSKILFAYDGDMLLINKDRAKEVIAHAAGRTVAEVFEEVFSEGGLWGKNSPKLSYQYIDISKLVEK